MWTICHFTRFIAKIHHSVLILLGVMNDMMEEVIGEVEVELDGRFSSIRTKETNLGEFSHSLQSKCTRKAGSNNNLLMRVLEISCYSLSWNSHVLSLIMNTLIFFMKLTRVILYLLFYSEGLLMTPILVWPKATKVVENWWKLSTLINSSPW